LGIGIPFELKYLGLFITLFSCLRLAIFNLDEEQKYYFKGLNTPSNTILLFGIFYVLMEKTFSKNLRHGNLQIWASFLNSIKFLALGFSHKNDCHEIQIHEIGRQLPEIGFTNRRRFTISYFRNHRNSISNHLLYFDFFNFSKKFKLKTN
jgi:hypothetical protein